MAAYTVNEDAVRRWLRSRWENVQPRAQQQNAFLKTHSCEEYAAWHLGLTEGAAEETKARYAFVCGDFRRLRRMGLIAWHPEWRHKEIEHARTTSCSTSTRRAADGVATPKGAIA